MNDKGRTRNTYFNEDYSPGASNYFAGFPFDANDEVTTDADEQTIFDDVLKHEHFLYETRGVLAFPEDLAVEWRNCPPPPPCVPESDPFADDKSVLRIPVFHDSRQVEIRNGDAVRSIVYVDDAEMWTMLYKADAHLKLRSAVICGSGLPRFGARKLISLLSRQLDVPVVVLSDWDPWGLFICSMFCRGTLVVATHDDLLMVKDVRYGGCRPSDFESPASVVWCPFRELHVELGGVGRHALVFFRGDRRWRDGSGVSRRNRSGVR